MVQSIRISIVNNESGKIKILCINFENKLEVEEVIQLSCGGYPRDPEDLVFHPLFKNFQNSRILGMTNVKLR